MWAQGPPSLAVVILVAGLSCRRRCSDTVFGNLDGCLHQLNKMIEAMKAGQRSSQQCLQSFLEARECSVAGEPRICHTLVTPVTSHALSYASSCFSAKLKLVRLKHE